MVPSDSRTVVIADNDDGVSGLLAEVLALRGLRTEVVADGERALQRVAAGGVALLVCDLDMPVLSGEQVLERLAATVDPPPALVVSGYLDAGVRARLERYPRLCGVLAKPFDVLRFGDRVVRLLAGEAAAGAE